jgi:hypothetical protein
MKNNTLYPGSVLVGVVLAGIALVLVGAQTPVVESVLHPSPRQVEVKVAGIPDPNDLVLVRQEDGPYTVPPGKILVINGLGEASFGSIDLVVDGVPVASTQHLLLGNFSQGAVSVASPTLHQLPSFPVRPGSVVTFSGAGSGRATGYLADVRR